MLLQAHTTKFMGIFRSTNLAKTPERFGSFDDSTKYGGAVPSEHYLRDVRRLYFSKLPVLEVDSVDWTLEEYHHRLMQRWDGDILGGDASFKFAKIIRLRAKAGEERTRPVYGSFTVFDEYEQVVWQRPMKTGALSELAEELKLFFMRFVRNGFKVPTLWNTDDCCDDLQLLQRILREFEEVTGISLYLEDEVDAGVQLELLPQLDMEFTPAIVYDPDAVAAACGSLRQSISQNRVEGKMICGADAEWQFSPRGRKPVATFQIAALKGPSFLFHLQRGSSGFTKETFPAPLKALLEDPSTIKAGVAINTDATHMLNDYGVKMASTVDLRVLAVSKLVVTSSRTLAGLTACLLGRQLPKDTVRCSRWGSAQLSVEQRDYAIRDAVASALLYEAIHKNKDPITSVPSSHFDPAIGLKVSAFALWYRPYFPVDRQQQIMAAIPPAWR
ncbi:unnamed protein product [Ectocarpus sp. CCAP 1310/34]|nr:unnamed protein product [Ectocarpus sp. CCAP 1310/34]